MMLHKLCSTRVFTICLITLVFIIHPFPSKSSGERDNGNETTSSYLNAQVDKMEATKDTVSSMARAGSDINVSNLPGNESNVLIDINPINPSNLVIAGNSPDSNAVNTFYTEDGGKTWTKVTLDDAIDQHFSSLRFDPALAFDKAGNVYIAYGVNEKPPTLMIQDSNGRMMDQNNMTTIVIAKSTDGGKSYTQVTDVFVEIDHLDFKGNEKIHLTTGPNPLDPSLENIYLTWTHNINENGVTDQEILVAASPDGGETFGLPKTINDPSIDGTEPFNLYAKSSTGPDGEIYVLWYNASSGNIFLDVSTDGGETFGTDLLITKPNLIHKTPIPAQPDYGIHAGPVIDVDRSSGPNRGRIYLSYADLESPEALDTDIFVMTSDDRGATWSPPVRVNHDEGNSSQFLPWLDVDQEKGLVSVVWLDARNDPSNQKVETFMAVSDDGAIAFESNIQVSDGQSDQSEANEQRSPDNYKNHIGIAGSACQMNIAWAGNSQDLSNLDFFTDRIDLNGLDTPFCNRTPVCNAGGPYIAECNVPFSLDGSLSSDEENDPLSFLWTGAFAGGTATGVSPSVQFNSTYESSQVELAVDDGALNAQCITQVAVIDSLPPVIEAPENLVAECSKPDGTTVELGFPIINDACDSEPIFSNDAPDQFPLGTTLVTWVAGDETGNSASDTQTVEVRDTLAPDIALEVIPVPRKKSKEKDDDGNRYGNKGRDDDDRDEKKERDERECLFQIKISASDGCDPNIKLRSWITVNDRTRKIKVSNGQKILFEKESDESEVEYDDGILEIEARKFTVHAEAVDDFGNKGYETAVVFSCPSTP